MTESASSPQHPTAAVLFMRRKRPGFDADWAKVIREKARRQLEEAAFDVFVPETLIVDDASLREALAECAEAGAEVYVVVQPTMSDPNLGVTISKHAGSVPVVFWATPEKQEGDMISSCSLVGAHAFGSTLRLMHRPFELVYGMPGEADTLEQLEQAVHLCSACGRLRGGKIGLIGYHAPGFIDMHASSWVTMNQLNVEVRQVGLHAYIDRVRSFEANTVSERIRNIPALQLPRRDMEEGDLDMACRQILAMEAVREEESLDALAIQCWPELPAELGQWPYVGLYHFAEEGFPAACEGDTDGALSMWIGSLLGLAPAGYLSDWLEHDEDTITLWHGGFAPSAMQATIGEDRGPRLARHFNNKKPGVVDGTLRAGMPVTVFRVWNCDGAYRVAALEGETVEPRRHLMGTNGLARIDGGGLHERFETLLHAGMPHHVCVYPGRRADTLKRFARLTGMEYVEA